MSGLELDKIYWTDTDLGPPASSQAPILTRGREKRKPTRHSSRGHWSGFIYQHHRSLLPSEVAEEADHETRVVGMTDCRQTENGDFN